MRERERLPSLYVLRVYVRVFVFLGFESVEFPPPDPLDVLSSALYIGPRGASRPSDRLQAALQRSCGCRPWSSSLRCHRPTERTATEWVRCLSSRFPRLDGNGSWLTVFWRTVFCYTCHCGCRQSSPVVVVVSVHTGKRSSRLCLVVLVVVGPVRRVRRVTPVRDGPSRRRSVYRLGARESSEHASAARLRTPDSGGNGVATGPACRVTSGSRWVSCPDRYFSSRPREDAHPRSGEAGLGRARRGPPFLARARWEWVGRGAACLPSVGRGGARPSSVGRGGTWSGEAWPAFPSSVVE
jgi:hypothetical protein